MRKTTGVHRPYHIAPFILGKESHKHHLPIYGLKPSSSDDVVMWTEGSTYLDGHDAGTHDGMRSGRSTGRVDMRFNHVCYALLSDWLEAGNAQPQ